MGVYRNRVCSFHLIPGLSSPPFPLPPAVLLSWKPCAGVGRGGEGMICLPDRVGVYTHQLSISKKTSDDYMVLNILTK